MDKKQITEEIKKFLKEDEEIERLISEANDLIKKAVDLANKKDSCFVLYVEGMPLDRTFFSKKALEDFRKIEKNVQNFEDDEGATPYDESLDYLMDCLYKKFGYDTNVGWKEWNTSSLEC
jgi:hypothetical protein